MLGCLIQANRSWKAEQYRWTSTALQFAMKEKKGQFDRICGAKLYPSYWISKFRYVAPVVGFSKLFCESTEKPVVASCLSATGFNMRFTRAVVFGSYKYGGMQWESMYSVQLHEKIKNFLRNSRSESRLGKLLQTTPETAQLFSGSGSHVLNTTVE